MTTPHILLINMSIDIICAFFFCLWTLKPGTLSSINQHCYQHLGSLWISLKPVNIKEVFFLIFFRKSSLGELKDTKQYFNISLLTSIPTFLKTIKNLPLYGTSAHYSFATLGDVKNLEIKASVRIPCIPISHHLLALFLHLCTLCGLTIKTNMFSNLIYYDHSNCITDSDTFLILVSSLLIMIMIFASFNRLEVSVITT